MYYVYYIKGVKVGCTNNLKRRVEEEQGYKDYQILFKSSDINKASEAERHYQEKLGYKVDRHTYKELINKNKQLKTIEMIHITADTVTFSRKTKEQITKDFLLNDVIHLEVNGEIIVLTEQHCEWIQAHLMVSQYEGMGPYIYNKAFLNAHKGFIAKDNIFNSIRNWAQQRGLYDKGDTKTQYVKLQEEAGELAKAILKNDKPEIVDAIGDIVVVLTNLAHLEGLAIEDCIESAYDVIKGRTGKMENGTFKKDEDVIQCRMPLISKQL